MIRFIFFNVLERLKTWIFCPKQCCSGRFRKEFKEKDLGLILGKDLRDESVV